MGFKDHVELSDNAITVFSFAVEVRKTSGIKQLKQLIVDMTTTFWYNEEKFKLMKLRLNECYYNAEIQYVVGD